MSFDTSSLQNRNTVHLAILLLTCISFIFTTVSLFTDGWASLSIYKIHLGTGGICCDAGGVWWLGVTLAGMFIAFIFNLALVIYAVAAWFALKDKPWLVLVDVIFSAVVCVSLLIVLIIFPAGGEPAFPSPAGMTPGYSYYLILPALASSAISLIIGMVSQRHQ